MVSDSKNKGEKRELRLLSIQSHVVGGYAGNKCAILPLQINGFEVDTINSVHFSNHTGYGKWEGEVLNRQQLKNIYKGLRSNELTFYTHLLTGYCGDPSFLEEVASVAQSLKLENPNLFFACDPVMGDNGQYYVPPALLNVYRDKILPLADLLTPNQFELQELTGLEISDQETLFKAIDALHDFGIKDIVVTSSDLGPPDQLWGFGSKFQGAGSKPQRFQFSIDKVDAIFVGTGDVTCALIVAWLEKTGGNLEESVFAALRGTQSVLNRTFDRAQRLCPDGLTVKELELRMVDSIADLKNPPEVPGIQMRQI